MYFRSISERGIGGYELKGGGRRLFVELLMLLFDGLVWTDNGGLGKLSMCLNEDVEDEVVAYVISSAMIDEGDDCDDFWPLESRVGVYIGMGN